MRRPRAPHAPAAAALVLVLASLLLRVLVPTAAALLSCRSPGTLRPSPA